MFFDVHLMISEPIRYIEAFAKCGVDGITVHVEACKDLEATLDKIKEQNMKCAVAINPDTEIEEITHVLEKVDMVLVMTVNPGFGGQKLIPYTVEKVRELRKIVDEKGLKTDIEVDGGVNLSNVEELMDAGANIIVAGSAIFSGDVTENTIRFLNIINE